MPKPRAVAERAASRGTGDDHVSHTDVAIVGAGFGGIGMGYHLKQAGIHDFVIFDRGSEVGGTWWFNRYPGCQCDIPAHLYSFSFALNPDWSRTYPLQAETQSYLRACASRFALLPHLRLDHEVEQAVWNDEQDRWLIKTSRGTYAARVLVGAHGGLSEPRLPEIPGRERFQGAALHTAEWDESVELAGKRVAVLGTGASAIQVVPNIQPEVGRLFVIQRTPPWVLPHPDRSITAAERWLYRHLPLLQRIPRAVAYAYREFASPAFTRYPRLLAPLEWRALQHMRRQVADPELRNRLKPDYRIGCKRILPTNEWYPALQKENVRVVTDGVAEITPRGIRTQTGDEVEIDVMIYATGFNVTDYSFANRLIGRGGHTLAETWRGSPQAYKNSTVPGFPNLFVIPGLNTGYSSMVYMIEAQLQYVRDALDQMRSRGLHTLEVTPEAYRRWNRFVQGKMWRTVWHSGGCSSWYVDRNGLATTVWPDFTWRFRHHLRRFDLAAYR